jgi:hypothetical protein
LRVLLVATVATLPRLLSPSITSLDADLWIMLYVALLVTTVSLDAAVLAHVVGWGVGSIVVILTSFLGLVPQRIAVAIGRVRYYWGFTNPNDLGMAVFVVSCCFYLLLRRHRGASLALIAGAVIIYLTSVSRTPIVALGVAAGLDWIARSKVARSRFFPSGVVMFASFVGWLGCLAQIESSKLLLSWPDLDPLLSYRVEGWSAFVKLSGWKVVLCGGALGQFQGGYVQGGYLQVFAAFGLIFLVVLMTMILSGVGRLSRHRQWSVVFIIVAWLMFSYTENVLVSPGFFPAILAWSVAVGKSDWPCVSNDCDGSAGL